MSASSTRLTKTHKVSIAGIAAAAVAALTFSLVPDNASAEAEGLVAKSASVKTLSAQERAALAKAHALTKAHAEAVAHAQANAHTVAKANAHLKAKAHDIAQANKRARVHNAAKAHDIAQANKKAAAKATAKKRAKALAASRAAARKPIYANNLDGWIREALDIMKKHNIPGSYEGLHRNIIRESAGNPNAINGWDINAINGTPSIGLLQVIKPTFDAYHVAGTANSQYDPVANIVAAANYAADRYGSIDNVNSAY